MPLWSRAPALAYAAIFVLLLLLAAGVARWEEAQDRVTLDALTPVVMTAARFGAPMVTAVRPLALTGIGVFAALAIAAVALRREQSNLRNGAVVPVIFILVGCAQVSVLWQSVALGVGLMAVAAAVALRAGYGTVLPSPTPRFAWTDCTILLAITAVAFVVRLYAINRVPENFEGELSPYYLGAASLAGILPANAGLAGPWSPLGLLFYPPIFLSIQFFGATVLAVRFSTAAVSLATLPLLYCLTLTTFGRPAAALAAIFFVLDPLQIGWGRTDVHPHGVTTWPAILIALATYRAFTDGRLRYFVGLAILMGLAWHQYPSGQFAVGIPILVFVITILRRQRIERAGAKAALLTAGLVMWAAGGIAFGQARGGIAEYVQYLGPRVGWIDYASDQAAAERLSAIAFRATGFLRDLVVGIFVQMPYRFHQDILIEIPDLPTRSVSWVVAALVLAALCLKLRGPVTTTDYVVLSWIIVAALPAVLSDRAHAKRAATLYPALMIVAASAGSRAFDIFRRAPGSLRLASAGFFAVALAAWVCATAALWFSGTRVRYGRPGEAVLSERVAPHLTPGTIVIADLWEHYQWGKLSFLLHDSLVAPERQPLLWSIVDFDRDVASFIADPIRAVSYAVPDRFYYRWSALGDLRTSALVQAQWKQVVYLLQAGLDDDVVLEEVKGGYPAAMSDRARVAMLQRRRPACQIEMFPPSNCDRCGFIVARCPLSP